MDTYGSPFHLATAQFLSWPWLSPLRGWGSVTITSTGKCINITFQINHKTCFTLVKDDRKQTIQVSSFA